MWAANLNAAGRFVSQRAEEAEYRHNFLAVANLDHIISFPDDLPAHLQLVVRIHA